MSATRVFVVDDHELIRRGVIQAFEDQEDLVVAGSAGSVRETLDLIGLKRPDVAVLDLRLPDGDGIELCREIRSRFPETKCLLFTSFADEEAVLQAVMAGASGFLLKDTDVTALIDGIRAIAAGGSLLEPETIQRVLNRASSGSVHDRRARDLTEQEHNILRLIGQGRTNKEIGAELFIAEQTVKNYVSSLLKKLGMQRRTQAAVFSSELEGKRPPR